MVKLRAIQWPRRSGAGSQRLLACRVRLCECSRATNRHQKLQRRTQRAIVELIRKRLEEEAAEEHSDAEDEGEAEVGAAGAGGEG